MVRESSGPIGCEGGGAAPCPCAPSPVLRGADESEEDFPGGHPTPPGLCSPEPRQLPKMLSAGDMIIPGGEEGESFVTWGFFQLRKEK